MDFKAGIGSLACRLCGAAYQMPIHHLHEPIDVFSEWLDDCEAAQNPQGPTGGGGVPQYDVGDDDIPGSSGLGERRDQKPAASDDVAEVGLVADEEDDDDE